MNEDLYDNVCKALIEKLREKDIEEWKFKEEYCGKQNNELNHIYSTTFGCFDIALSCHDKNYGSLHSSFYYDTYHLSVKGSVQFLEIMDKNVRSLYQDINSRFEPEKRRKSELKKLAEILGVET